MHTLINIIAKLPGTLPTHVSLIFIFALAAAVPDFNMAAVKLFQLMVIPFLMLFMLRDFFTAAKPTCDAREYVITSAVVGGFMLGIAVTAADNLIKAIVMSSLPERTTAQLTLDTLMLFVAFLGWRRLHIVMRLTPKLENWKHSFTVDKESMERD
jgi:hypothetical protein